MEQDRFLVRVKETLATFTDLGTEEDYSPTNLMPGEIKQILSNDFPADEPALWDFFKLVRLGKPKLNELMQMPLRGILGKVRILEDCRNLFWRLVEARWPDSSRLGLRTDLDGKIILIEMYPEKED